ncbi:MAG: hypothetical protein NVS3B21_20920 [Acidimicrobiales bacterium]
MFSPQTPQIAPDGSVEEQVEEPSWPDDLGTGGSDPIGEGSVSRNHNRPPICFGNGGDRVVAFTG